MTLASFFTAIGVDVPSDHALHNRDVPISENLFRLGAAILATGLDVGIDCPTDQELLAAARLAERTAATASALRTACLAKADEADAAHVDGLTMADVIAEERHIPKNEATTAIQLAARQAQFPAALAKAAAGRISQANLATAVDTLAHLRPMYTDDEFVAVEDLVLKEAEIPSAAAFKKKCRTTLALLDETYRMSQEALHAKRRKQVFDDRGLSFSLIDDGEYGAQVFGIIPPEYLRELLPALNKASESAARHQRRERRSGRADDLKVRTLDAAYWMITGKRPPVADEVASILDDVFPADGLSDASRQTTGTVSAGTAGTASATAAATLFDDETPGNEPTGDEPTRDKPDVRSTTDVVGTDSASTTEDAGTDNASTTNEPSDEARAPAAPETRLPALPSAIERSRETWDTTTADCGRTSRLATPELRRLLTLRDGGCVFPLCTDPPERCIAHHIHAWETGGETNLRNLVLLCSLHHPRVEHPPDDPLHWTIIIGPDGIPAARPPTRIDPERRLVYHPRHASPAIRLPIPGAALPTTDTTAPTTTETPTSTTTTTDTPQPTTTTTDTPQPTTTTKPESASAATSSDFSPDAPVPFRVATELFSGITQLRAVDLPPF